MVLALWRIEWLDAMSSGMTLDQRREYTNMRTVMDQYYSGNLAGNELEGAVACVLGLSVVYVQCEPTLSDGVPVSGDLIARLV